MCAESVSMQKDPTSLVRLPVHLRTITGAICPQTLLVSVFGESNEDNRNATLAHEAYHYQQLISTPFGIHLALLDWAKCLHVSHTLIQMSREGVKTLHVPLMFELFSETEIREDLKFALEAAFATSRYLEWLLDYDVSMESDSEEVIEEGLREVLNIVTEALRNLGGELSNMKKYTFIKLPPKPYYPSITDRMLLGRHIIENAATIAVPSEEGSHEFAPQLQLLSDRYPEDYTYLIQAASRLIDYKDLAHHSFAQGFISLCDLSLFAPLLPTMPEFGDHGNWIDIHPSWRFAQAFDVLKEDKELCDKLFCSGDINQVKFACDSICKELGWPNIEIVTEKFDAGILVNLQHPFSWLGNQFQKAWEYRKSHNGFLFPRHIIATQGLLRAIDTFDLDSQTDFQEHARIVIESMLSNVSELMPPIVIDGTEITHLQSDSELISYVSIWFYVSHFVNKLLTQDDLDYPIELTSTERIRELFEMCTGFPPEQIVKHPLPPQFKL
jgi:hypothetical protein